MAQYYSSIKTMKSARIGTIMPWGGDGNEGFTVANLPKGWIVADGGLENGVDYPLLASEIGKTYGGDLTGDFPNFTGQFQLPDVANKGLVDLEKNYLSDARYQFGQADALLVVGDSVGDGTGDDIANDFGPDAVKITHNAYADIDFTFNNPQILLTGKFTGQTISDPDFFTSVSTISRKLGINHIPAHSHRTTFQNARANFTGPQVFDTAAVSMGGVDPHSSGRCSNIVKSRNNTCSIATGDGAYPSWRDGATFISYYGDTQHEHTIPTMSGFHEFLNDPGKDYWSAVPAPSWHDGTGTRNSMGASTQDVVKPMTGVATNTFTYSPFDNDPTTTDKTLHYHPAWSGMHPRPQSQNNRRNYYGNDTGATLNQIPDNPEDPLTHFVVNNVTVNPQVSQITLPQGTDIRTTKTEGSDTYYIEDKIRPYRLVEGATITPGTHITRISRTGNDLATYEYTIYLSKQTRSDASGSPDATITFKDGTWPSTLNTIGSLNPNDTTFGSHNHGTFDIQMSVGSLKPTPTFAISNVSLGNVVPQSEENALNIIVTTSQPAMACVYIIKAY
tara:strand:- start:6360 stop:8039 length:1680 start_codon:yes stop_codon:yes gene_type:complete